MYGWLSIVERFTINQCHNKWFYLMITNSNIKVFYKEDSIDKISPFNIYSCFLIDQSICSQQSLSKHTTNTHQVLIKCLTNDFRMFFQWSWETLDHHSKIILEMMVECFVSSCYNHSTIVQKTFVITKQTLSKHFFKDCQVIIMIFQNTFNKRFGNDCSKLIY